MRGLVERTGSATKEIVDTIRQILDSVGLSVDSMKECINMVDSGVALSEKAGKLIVRIGQSARRVVVAVSDISDALKEQSVASQDIARQIERITQSTEENSAAVAHTADSSKRLNQLGLTMLDSVVRFEV